MNQSLEDLIYLSEECLKVNPHLNDIREALGTMYLCRARELLGAFQSTRQPDLLNQATEYTRRTIKLHSGPVLKVVVEAYMIAATCAQAAGRDAAAEECLDIAVLLHTFLPPKDCAALIPQIEVLITNHPSHSGLQEMLAGVYLLRGQEELHTDAKEYEFEGFSRAIDSWKKALSISPNNSAPLFIRAYYTLATLLVNQARTDEALEVIAQVRKLQEGLAESHPLGARGIRIFQTRSATLTNIGQLVNEMEFFSKCNELGAYDRRIKGVLLAPKSKVINPCALDYWRRHVCAVTSGLLVKRFTPLADKLEFDTFYYKLADGSLDFQWRGMIALQQQWEKAGRGPLLKITAAHRRRGTVMLDRLKIPKDAWYVTMHVRDMSQGKDGKQVLSRPTSNRDADIYTYQDAMRAVVERGGYVVRLGDRSMKKLPKMDGVIDYPHTDVKCDWMDIFLIATSKFFIGTASGLCGVPINFGVPTVLTNVSPMGSFPLCSFDTFLPKLLYSNKEGRHMTFRESLSPPLDFIYNISTFEHHGISLVDNTPDELRDAAMEMLDRLNGYQSYTDQEEQLQRNFQSTVRQVQKGGIQCRLANSFLLKHRELLDAESSLATKDARCDDAYVQSMYRDLLF